jgi:hypothetical protein
LFFDARDQVANGIGWERLRDLRLRLGACGGCVGLMLVRIGLAAGRDQGWGLGLGRRGSRFLGMLASEERPESR